MKRTQTTAQQFLSDFHGENHINFRAIKEKSVKINGYLTNVKAQLTQLNEQGFNIYFVVNGGGDKDEQINKINAVFVDFDYPKKGKALPELDEVEKYKQEQLKKIFQIKQFKPSYIVETRNGLHVYWLVYEGASVEQFTEAQHRLIEYFDSDKTIKNPSRVMRLPSFNWVKEINHPFMVNVMERNINRYTNETQRYDIQSIIDTLPECTEPIKKVSKSKISLGVQEMEYIKPYSILRTPKPHTNTSDIIDAILKRNVEYLRGLYNLPHKIVSNKTELTQYIRSVDLHLILGIEDKGAFRCIFHDDNNPSAHIFRADNGASMYKCHSGSCGVSYNIINIFEKLGNFKTRPEAYKFIEQVLNVDYVLSENQTRQIESLDENIDFLMFDLRNEYPSVYSNIRHQVDYLIKLNQMAKKVVSDYPQFDVNGQAMFFSSISDLCDLAEISNNKQNKIVQKNVVLQYHMFLNKLSDAEIPNDILNNAKALQIEKGHSKRVNFYSIPSYTTNQIEQSETQAKKWRENSYTIKGASREMFYRKEGSEIADWLYPQHTHITTKNGDVIERTTTSKQDEIQLEIVNVIMSHISDKGYCTEKDIIDSANISIEKAKRYIKVNLPEILDLYGLERTRATKELKTKFGITGTGSPFLLLKTE